MVWALLLAHFLGDFPLQADWMIRRKANLWVLALHGSIHFVLMVLLMGGIRQQIWPHLLLLTLVHMVQDHLKILMTIRWPERMVFLFFLDQLLHYLAIWGFVSWIQATQELANIFGNQDWVIITIAYLIGTYVWYISERVISHSDNDYLEMVKETKIERMLARSGLISLFLLARAWMLPNLALALSWPYRASSFRKRAVVSDVSVSLGVIIFLFVALGLS